MTMQGTLRGGGRTISVLERSISNGGLSLSSAVFADSAADIVSSYAVTPNGLHIVGQNSAAATINTIANAAVWVWPLTTIQDLSGSSLPASVNLTERPWQLGIVERYTSLPPSLLTCWVGLCDNADPRAARQQLAAIEYGWSSTTVRRCGIVTATGGAAEVRTVGAGVADEHLGAVGSARPHTHQQIAQMRVYPLGMDGLRSEAPGANAQGSTLAFEMHATTHFFLALSWNSVAGATPEIIIDPSLYIGPYLVPS